MGFKSSHMDSIIPLLIKKKLDRDKYFFFNKVNVFENKNLIVPKIVLDLSL